MSADKRRVVRAERSSGRVTVRVQRTTRGRWTVAVAGGRERITCETLDDARRVALLAVGHTGRCELIVHDAYHRVIDRELISGHGDASPVRAAATLNEPTHNRGR